jgi:hypothetical protein
VRALDEPVVVIGHGQTWTILRRSARPVDGTTRRH